MRAHSRRHVAEEEGESAFISMTDMTVGFLFIVMILLAFFASQFRNEQDELVPRARLDAALKDVDRLGIENQQLREENEALRDANVDLVERLARLQKQIEELLQARRDPLEDYMATVATARLELLERLRSGLKADFPGLQVVLSEQNDALQFQGEGLFALGSDRFNPGKEAIVRRIAQRLAEILPCYTFGGPGGLRTGCSQNLAVIEAVQIEGHTDSSGSYRLNTRLSADRATTTFSLMIATVPELKEFENLNHQAVMSFAGYGPDRPVARNDTSTGRATNRRIDLRFIMVTPRSPEQIEEIRRRFADLGAGRP